MISIQPHFFSIKAVRALVLSAIISLVSFSAMSQNTPAELPTINDDEFGFTGRFSAGLDWKIYKGLRLDAEYELRTHNNFAAVERHQASLGLSYKVCNYFRAGVAYTFIGHYKSSDGSFSPRHRASLHLSGMYDAGMWHLTLRESLEMTHKSASNPFQDTPYSLELRSRFKVSYRGFAHWEPYAYVELRNCFNDPSFNATWDEAGQVWTDYAFLGYKTAYVNRVRAVLGVEWKITRNHSIDLSALYHWTHGLEIDTNKEGTKLKSAVWENASDMAISLGYKFSF